MLTSMKEIKELYKIDYISETDLDSSHHFLWRGSDKLLQHETFNNLMCYQQTKNNTFGKVPERQLLHYQSQKTKPSLVKKFCSEINNIESVYFIQLSKYQTEDVVETNISHSQKETEYIVNDDVPQMGTDNLVDVWQSRRVC